MDEQPDVMAASELLQYMSARSTDGGTVDARAFACARSIVLRDEIGKRYAPECVRICREPDAVWTYVKSQEPDLGTYHSRRVFFREAFEPLLSALEQVDHSPLDDLVADKGAELECSASAARIHLQGHP